ncbi:hypothetical protein GF339_07840 [candidate division KSB3 bacterium]|uniref:Uncharacterized protein n=1 Tax=candidate division KSB3 bacterium TaxID=2044937 RepID=A0A9D5Q630_9BACT|nr:hypothetical protein [candidate division KSB3 bacterium]MBD3324481.1 hypothetical protein [candidate division KSB3 bacterium]
MDGTVSDNSADFAGGIFNYDTGTITINGTVSGNTATTSTGGIHNQNGILIVNGEVSGNTANSFGGGISNIGTGTLSFGPDNLIEDNTADADDVGGETGGGIYNWGTINTPPLPDYGTGNWTGTAAPVLDNCDGPGGCP